MNPAAAYSARQTGVVVELNDSRNQTTVSILPALGNLTVEMKVKVHNVLRFPFTSAADYTGGSGSIGIPFLAPWANRLDEQAFYANGKRYAFDMSLGNIRGAIPIHGFITTTDRWQLASTGADRDSAWATSRLEFHRQEAWMKQWPFAHTIEMTYRLRDGVLEVATAIENLGAEPMPVSVGFHPYFTLTDSRRDEWTISVGARTHWKLQPNKVPTGETEPIERFFPNPSATALRDVDLDDDFSDLVRDARGRATMTLRGKAQRLDVEFGANFRAAVVWAPKETPGGPERNFICFEPMAAMTNGLNMAQKGLYRELQSVPPGGTWRESFWIRPSGF